ncbi:MAG: hypothetical protein ACPGUV_07305 [Polyangiales bacterium]
MAKPSPLAAVRARFESKEALVEAVRALATEGLWLDRVNEDKGLERVSNRKLLHLHALLSDVQGRFGSRTGLIDAILELEKRSKDEGYRQRLSRFPLPRLLDQHRSCSKRQPRAAA